jgi:hypothetical protein
VYYSYQDIFTSNSLNIIQQINGEVRDKLCNPKTSTAAWILRAGRQADRLRDRQRDRETKRERELTIKILSKAKYPN